MKGSRNKKAKEISKSAKDVVKEKSVDGKSVDLDINNENKNSFDDDSSDDSSINDEIEQKISSICERNKNNFLSQENTNEIDTKNDKKKTQKIGKKTKKNNFNDFFEANNKIDDYYEVNYPELNKYDLKIDTYSDLFKLMSKNEIFPTLLKDEDKKIDEENNNINRGNVNKLMYDLLLHNFNIFLYGFGSKVRLVLNFLDEFLKKYYEDSDIPLYVISCNLNNFEMNFKVILNKIQSCLEIEFEKYYKKSLNEFAKEITSYGRITKFLNIYTWIYDKLNNQDTFSKDKNDKESEIDDSDSDLQSSEEPKEELKENKEDIKKNVKEKKDPFKILLILNNIGSNIGQNKNFHNNLSELVNKLDFINLLVTCENLVVPYFWDLEAKDKYRFCFIKYHTFEPYDSEIDENNSITNSNSIREGNGLREIFSSFSETQKRLMKEIAKLNLKGDHDHLTQKGLVNYFVETGIGIVTDIQKLETLLVEAIDHDIVELKISNENNKEIYKMKLEKNLIEKIAEGEFM